MRINKKGFILIETLAVTVFAASIFVFLFKSVAPLLGYYNNRMEQLGNIDSVFNNYNLRKFVYRDEYFNNNSSDNNNVAIKNLDYTLISCSKPDRTGLTGSDVNLLTTLYSTEYCNSLMENIGAREKVNNNYQNHFLIFYVKSSSLKKFMNEGLNKYQSLGIKLDGYSLGVFDDEDTKELFISAIKEITDSEEFQDNEASGKGYLIFYYLYLNPNYVDGIETTKAKHKESINILPMVTSSNNLNCYTWQIIPNHKYFYKYTLSGSDITNYNTGPKYYFYHDAYDYNVYNTYKSNDNNKINDDIENCVNGLKNRFDKMNNPFDKEEEARAYCRKVLTTNNQFYTIYKLTDTNKCMHYFKDRTINNKKLTASELETFCTSDKFNNLDLPNDWDNFIDARFATRVFDLSDSNPEIAIVGYDKTCAKDVIVPETAYGFRVSVIGYEAFKDSGIRSIKLNSNIKIIDKNAFPSIVNRNEELNKYILDNGIKKY